MPLSEGQTIDNTLGSLFLGSVFAAVMYGVTSLQAYWYYHWFYKRDSLLHRISVGLLWALDSVHLFLVAHGVYYYCVSSFGDAVAMLDIIWSVKVQVTINVVIILLVQGLYTYRVWLLGGYHKSILAYVVVAIVAGAFAIGIVLAHEVNTISTFDEHQKIRWAIIASLSTATVVDFIIAGAMCYYLRKSRGLQTRVNSNLAMMSQFVLGSGFLTSAFSTAALVSYLASPHTLIFIGIESILTKLYINSFFAMLNARERGIPLPTDQPRLSVRIPSLSKSPALPSTISVRHDVHVERHYHEKVDGDDNDMGDDAEESDKSLIVMTPQKRSPASSWTPTTPADSHQVQRSPSSGNGMRGQANFQTYPW